jgi:hypothetical protein
MWGEGVAVGWSVLSGSYCISMPAYILVCVCVCVGGGYYVINCVWQVLIARRYHLPSCSSCNPKEPARSLLHCVEIYIRLICSC